MLYGGVQLFDKGLGVSFAIFSEICVSESAIFRLVLLMEVLLEKFMYVLEYLTYVLKYRSI